MPLVIMVIMVIMVIIMIMVITVIMVIIVIMVFIVISKGPTPVGVTAMRSFADPPALPASPLRQ